jgi:hypothetical protein
VRAQATDTVTSNYRKRLADRGIADGEYGAVTVIQRANSDLRLSPHFHVLQLDGVYAPWLPNDRSDEESKDDVQRSQFRSWLTERYCLLSCLLE